MRVEYLAARSRVGRMKVTPRVNSVHVSHMWSALFLRSNTWLVSCVSPLRPWHLRPEPSHACSQTTNVVREGSQSYVETCTNTEAIYAGVSW